jgi:predicted O-methyltransferase YrrM
MTIASAVRMEAIRHYAMRRTVPLRMQTENYPTLEAKYLDNPRLHATREDLISSMRFLEGGVIAEVGVAYGDLSEYLLNELKPEKFVAIDIFTMHNQKRYSFDGMSHLDYYTRKFANRGDQVAIEVGMSDECLAKYADRTFDMIYIDADHSYEAVKRDINVAKAKLADNGVIMLNDYIMFDHLDGVSYGVVQAVNEFIVQEDWRVCGFSLERNMFCDIAIRRRS